jgi:hypothetical protein
VTLGAAGAAGVVIGKLLRLRNHPADPLANLERARESLERALEVDLAAAADLLASLARDLADQASPAREDGAAGAGATSAETSNNKNASLPMNLIGADGSLPAGAEMNLMIHANANPLASLARDLALDRASLVRDQDGEALASPAREEVVDGVDLESPASPLEAGVDLPSQASHHLAASQKNQSTTTLRPLFMSHMNPLDHQASRARVLVLDQASLARDHTLDQDRARAARDLMDQASPERDHQDGEAGKSNLMLGLDFHEWLMHLSLLETITFLEYVLLMSPRNLNIICIFVLFGVIHTLVSCVNI